MREGRIFDGSWLTLCPLRSTVAAFSASTTAIGDTVDRNIAPDYPYFASFTRLHGVPYRSDRSSAEAAPTHPAGAALFVIVLLSLGLCGAIWVAAFSLASAPVL